MSQEKLDQLEALLEQGWSNLHQGRFADAEKAARAGLAVEPEMPDIYTLLGAIAAHQGDVEVALGHYEKASEIDPEYVQPLLYAAELHFGVLEDPVGAMELCERALEVAEEEDEYLDALLLKAEIHINEGEEDDARKTLADLPPTDYPEPVFHLRAGQAWLDLDEFDRAEKELQKAIAQEGDFADAHHALGLVHAARDHHDRMIEAFVRVRDLDLAEPAAPWALPKERFAELAEKAHAELPERIRELLANVPILVEDYPSRQQVDEGEDPRMMGFFSGVPHPEASSVGGPPHLDHVVLYQRNIERVAHTPEEVAEEIRVTLIHETGHFLGLSEEELEEMGLG
ncbi:MAG TPA: metallopeptidase family protein [Polyangia bacterium]|nr:metallopeptidase family protein [Polyangia bacterium]